MDENKDLKPETEEEEDIIAEEEALTSDEAVEEETEETAEETKEEPEEEKNGEDVEKTEEKSASRPKKKAPFIVAAAAVLAVALAVIFSVVLSSPKAVFKRAVGCIEDGEYAKVLDYTGTTQFYFLNGLSDMTDEEKTAFVRENLCGDFIDKVEAGSGLSVEITQIKEYTEEEVEIIRTLFSNNEENEISIEAFKGITFNWVIEQTGEKHEGFAYLIKENGKWAVHWSV